jgi:hypothetical protein
MLKDMVDLNAVILSFETVLKIEYDEPNTKKVIDNSIKKLENSYGMRIAGKSLYDLEVENSNLADTVHNLLHQILECTKTLSFLFQAGMFQHDIPVSLGMVKYLGLGKESLQTILRYFQNADEYYLAKNAVSQLMMGLDGIDMSTMKRMFIIMLALDELGVREAVAIIAQYMYYGSVWEDYKEEKLQS